MEPNKIQCYTPYCTKCVYILVETKSDQISVKLIIGYRGAISLIERVYTHLDVNTSV